MDNKKIIKGEKGESNVNILIVIASKIQKYQYDFPYICLNSLSGLRFYFWKLRLRCGIFLGNIFLKLMKVN